MLLITALGVIIVRLVVSLIKRIINIATLKKAAKHPEYYPRTESGIVFNKKTGKLESSGSKTILPF